jgi:polyferredoxin
MKSKAFPQKLRIIIAVLSFCTTIVAFIKANSILATWISFQAGPTIVRLLTSFSLSVLVVVLTLGVTALLFGRFYCSLICPFGILQDIINFLNPFKKTVQKYNLKKTRYLIAAVSIALLAAGVPFIFLTLDPYSNFGRISAAMVNPIIIYIHNLLTPSNYIAPNPMDLKSFIACTIPLIILISTVLWRKRFFCTAICPIGTLVGLCSKKVYSILE